MKLTIALILSTLTILLAAPLAAQTVDQRELVEVVGVGELKAVPNEFVLRSSITSFHKVLSTASSKNDQVVAKLFGELSKLGIARKYIVTDQIAVNAVTEGYRERGNYRRLGFTVSRDIMVVLHKAKRVEPAMKALFAVGVDRLSVSTGHTDMNSMLENAQIKAAAAAKRKAKLMSSALGRTLGAAVSISEEQQHRSQPQSFVYTAGTPDLGDTLSLGKLRLQSAVRVKFLLKP